MQKILLRIFGVFGTFTFVPLFFFTFSDPQSIERAGRSFIEWKLGSEVEAKINSVEIPTSTKLGKLLNKTVEAKLEDLKQQLKDDVPAILATEMAKMRNPSCECRKKWEQRLRQSINFQIASLDDAKSKISDFTQAKYMEVVTNLTRDVRIFLGANSIVFILLLLVSLLKPKAIVHLFLPGSLLFVSTLICSYFYLFEQNWFFTILYNSYTGFGYVIYLVFVFAFLCDIVFNKGRVTVRILNFISEALGSGGNLAPC